MQPAARKAVRVYLPSIAVASLALAAAAAWWLATRQPDQEPPAPSPVILSEAQPGPVAAARRPAAPEIGSPAPDFTLKDLEGRTVRLSDLRGRPVMINFWATWCPPCREEMPHIEEFVRRFGGRIEVLGVDVGEPAELVRAFLEKNPYSWRFLLDSDGQVMERYRVFAIPTSYFIDREGIVRAVYTGAMSPEQLRGFARQAGVPVD
ncbi:MAG: TlpA disulfide reductase family protein [Bacillota bacterium]